LNKAKNWLEKALQYRFVSIDLFKQALTHRSFSKKNNERLEFLGDAVLDFVVSEKLFELRPNATEGDLSKLRSFLVKETTLAELAFELDLGRHLILGSGELKAGGNRRESILSDALEAILGAIFLDQGFNAVREVINHIYSSRYIELPELSDLRDPKTKLQEWLQERKMALPSYELIQVLGKNHQQNFVVTCFVSEEAISTQGKSTTRRKAEQEAAQKMAKLLKEKIQ
tara:strand:- start:1832 stop:2515 length:684 start_codon:yes stop_codon:yes gene_type:complete